MRNDKPLKTRVLVSSIILMFMVLCDIYMIASIPKNYQLLAIAAFVTFLWMTFTLDGWISLREMGIQEREEQYQDLLKAEKASYLIFQQKFQDLDNKLNFIGQKIMPLEKANSANQKTIASMLDGLREDQKKIAKLTVSRSKENADALISSNGQLLSQMGALLQTVGNIEEIDSLGQAETIQHEILSLKNTQDEIMARLQEISSLLGGSTQQLPKGAGQPFSEAQKPLSDGAGEPLSSGELEALLSGIEAPREEAQDAESMDAASEEAQEPLPPATETAQEEPEPEAEPEKGEELSQPAAEAEQEEPEAEPEKGEDLPSSASKAAQEELETASEEGQGLLPPAAETEREESDTKPDKGQKEQEPEAKPAPAKPNPADPNRMMTPEDIAALIANTAVEELPDTAPQIEEEKPPKPDISDPNKMMSPEDIAALIANM